MDCHISKNELEGDDENEAYNSGSIYNKIGHDKSVNIALTTQIHNNLNIYGNANVLENINACGDVRIEGDMKLMSSLSLEENLNISGNLNVTDNVSFSNDLRLHGDLCLSEVSEIKIGNELQEPVSKFNVFYNSHQYYFNNIKKGIDNSTLGNRVIGIPDPTENIFSKYINIYNEQIPVNVLFTEIEAYIDNYNTEIERNYNYIIYYYNKNDKEKKTYPENGFGTLTFNKKGTNGKIKFKLNNDGSINDIIVINNGSNYYERDIIYIKEDINNGVNEIIKIKLLNEYLTNNTLTNNIKKGLFKNYVFNKINLLIELNNYKFKIKIDVNSNLIEEIKVLEIGNINYNENDTITIDKSNFGSNNDLIITLNNNDIFNNNLIIDTDLSVSITQHPNSIELITQEFDLELEANINHLKSNLFSSKINNLLGIRILKDSFIELKLWSLDDKSVARDIIINLKGQYSRIVSITSGDLEGLISTEEINSSNNINTSCNINVSGNLNVLDSINLGNTYDLNNNNNSNEGTIRFNKSLNKFQGNIKEDNINKWIDLNFPSSDFYSEFVIPYNSSLFHIPGIINQYIEGNILTGLENTPGLIKYETIDDDVFIDKFEILLGNNNTTDINVTFKLLVDNIEQPINLLNINNLSFTLFHEEAILFNISINNVNSHFIVGEEITGVDVNNKAIVLRVIYPEQLLVKIISGTFSNGENITGNSNGLGIYNNFEYTIPLNLHFNKNHTIETLIEYFEPYDYILSYNNINYKFELKNKYNTKFAFVNNNFIKDECVLNIDNNICSIELTQELINNFNLSNSSQIYIYGCKNNNSVNGVHNITINNTTITFSVTDNATPIGNIYLYKYNIVDNTEILFILGFDQNQRYDNNVYESLVPVEHLLEKQLTINYNNDNSIYEPYNDYIYNETNRLYISKNKKISIFVKSNTDNNSQALIKFKGSYKTKQVKILSSSNSFDNVEITQNCNISQDLNIVGNTVINNNLGVGIDQPIAPLHIESSSNTQNDPNTHKVSLYASDVIYTGSYYISDSDERIKYNITNSSINTDYYLFDKINIYNYEYIDKSKSIRSQKGFIAQNVHKYFPDAIDSKCGFIPNIMQYSNVFIDNNGFFIKLNNIDYQEILNKYLKCIVNNKVVIIYIKKNINNNFYFIDNRLDSNKEIFVYGIQVEDLMSVDYNKLHCIHFNTTKHLINKIDSLENEIQNIKNKIKHL